MREVITKRIGRNKLGEGPVWDDRTEHLWWIDILEQKLFSMNNRSGDVQVIDLAVQITAIAFRSNSGMVAVGAGGFGFLNSETGVFSPVINPEASLSGTRFNDGGCDPQGRFIAGTMDLLEKAPLGSVYSWDGAADAGKLFGGYVVCNGPAFSPDGETLYFSNSAGKEIILFDFDPETGKAFNPTLFARFEESDGYPDGLAVDVEGCLWCAHWDGWRLSRFAPDGRVDCIVEMPVPRPTSCAFGGPELTELYVTSARFGLTDQQLAEAPLSGSLFTIKTDVPGLPVPRFAG